MNEIILKASMKYLLQLWDGKIAGVLEMKGVALIHNVYNVN